MQTVPDAHVVDPVHPIPFARETSKVDQSTGKRNQQESTIKRTTTHTTLAPLHRLRGDERDQYCREHEKSRQHLLTGEMSGCELKSAVASS